MNSRQFKEISKRIGLFMVAIVAIAARSLFFEASVSVGIPPEIVVLFPLTVGIIIGIPVVLGFAIKTRNVRKILKEKSTYMGILIGMSEGSADIIVGYAFLIGVSATWAQLIQQLQVPLHVVLFFFFLRKKSMNIPRTLSLLIILFATSQWFLSANNASLQANSWGILLLVSSLIGLGVGGLIAESLKIVKEYSLWFVVVRMVTVSLLGQWFCSLVVWLVRGYPLFQVKDIYLLVGYSVSKLVVELLNYWIVFTGGVTTINMAFTASIFLIALLETILPYYSFTLSLAQWVGMFGIVLSLIQFQILKPNTITTVDVAPKETIVIT